MGRADIEVPNLVVDVNSWTRLACYPRSSFYPLSFRRPISYGRITNFCFRNCSSCRNCSKAGLCVCTFNPISIRVKPTFVNASVTFWEATAPVKLPTRYCLSPGLRDKIRIKNMQGWYLTGARRLPPILNMHAPNPISSCSKASRGLFVRLRVTGIFTGLAISPSPLLRQFSNRYSIRAGRNLPDKEFRYLRTVIVTAGVHPRFRSELAPFTLTFGHWPGVSPYTSPYGFAETCVFGKQSFEIFRCGSIN
jgi:hypothetical protein